MNVRREFLRKARLHMVSEVQSGVRGELGSEHAGQGTERLLCGSGEEAGGQSDGGVEATGAGCLGAAEKMMEAA